MSRTNAWADDHGLAHFLAVLRKKAMTERDQSLLFLVKASHKGQLPSDQYLYLMLNALILR